MLSYDPTAVFELDMADVTYLRHEAEEYLARMYRPIGAEDCPVLLSLHGGAWCGGDRLQQESFNEALARTGILVASIDFRVAPGQPYPAQVADSHYAVRWLKENAPRYGGSTESLGLIGDSSGAHTAMMIGLCPGDSAYWVHGSPGEGPDASVDFVVSLWGVLDPHERFEYARDAGRSVLVDRTMEYFQDLDCLARANPKRILDTGEHEALPPLLMIQGTGDDNVPLSIPEGIKAAYEKHGGTVVLEYYDGMPHKFAAEPGPETDRALQSTAAFVRARVEEPHGAAG